VLRGVRMRPTIKRTELMCDLMADLLFNTDDGASTGVSVLRCRLR